MNRILTKSLLVATFVVGISAIVPLEASGQLFGGRRSARCCQPVQVCCPPVYHHYGHHHHGYYNPGYHQMGSVIPHQSWTGNVSGGYYASGGYHYDTPVYGGNYYVGNQSSACCGATYTSGPVQSGTSLYDNQNYNQDRQNYNSDRDNIPSNMNSNQLENRNTNSRDENPPAPTEDFDR